MASKESSTRKTTKTTKTTNPAKKVAAKVAKKAPTKKREDAASKVKDAVWFRAAGHCELCSRDLTYERLALTPAKLGEVAHILPASPDGPRGTDGRQAASVGELLDRNDPGNLMLLCGVCHDEIDKTPNHYPAEDLTAQHEAFLEAIRFAATRAKAHAGQGFLIQGNHFENLARIDPTQIQTALWRDHIRPLGRPLIIDLPKLDGGVRDDDYYKAVRRRIQHLIDRLLPAAQSEDGDGPVIGVAGIADMPSLMIAGQTLGDRRRRKVYSHDRTTGLAWAGPSAEPKDFGFFFDPQAPGPVALVLEISAPLPLDDVRAAAPDANIARFTAAELSYAYIQNERFIHHFREQLQPYLGVLEAHSQEPIHLFMAIPAALAFELGALLSTNHRHPYRVYDRDDHTKQFRHHLTLARAASGAVAT